jgi:uncharacterized membrane protein
MRQLMILVPTGQANLVVQSAEKYNPIIVSWSQVDTPDGSQEKVILHVANNQVGRLLDDLSAVPDGQITLDQSEILTLIPPDEEVTNRIVQVKKRSPMEVWLNGLQSIGSWKSFLSYAVAAGLVVWIGLLTNTVYLLVAAMLIAPFGGPAMNASLATASGDLDLLRSSVQRYAAGLLTLIVTAWLVSLIWQLDQVTNLAMSVSQLSATAVLLPLITGGIGAMNLIEPEGSSLVPGTAVGLLVAASLAPPAGVAGMALALQQWTLLVNSLFVLALQLVSINFAGALMFRFYGGLTPEGSRYQRGRRLTFIASLSLSLLAGIGLLWLQFQDAPSFQRSTQAQRAATEAAQVVKESELATFVSANFEFTDPARDSEETLLGILYVARRPDVALPTEEIEVELMRQVQARLLEQGFNATPLISVNVLTGPGQPP